MPCRTSLAEPEILFLPDQPDEITLDVSVAADAFLPGQRIRLQVSSSNIPRYDRNTNTGRVIDSEALDHAVDATNRPTRRSAGPASRLTDGATTPRPEGTAKRSVPEGRP